MPHNHRFSPGLERLGARRPPTLCNPMAIFVHAGELLPPPIPEPPPPIPGIPLPPQSLFVHHFGLSPVLPADPIP